MTCRVLVRAPDGTCVEARALLDNASSTSFVSERLSQVLQLPCTSLSLRISGIAGLSRKSPLQAVTSFTIIPIYPSDKKINVTALVVPQVTCDLPFHPISFKKESNHLSSLQLAYPEFGSPGKIDLLLGVDVYVDVLLHGRWSGPPNSPEPSRLTLDGFWLALLLLAHPTTMLQPITLYVSLETNFSENSGR